MPWLIVTEIPSRWREYRQRAEVNFSKWSVTCIVKHNYHGSAARLWHEYCTGHLFNAVEKPLEWPGTACQRVTQSVMTQNKWHRIGAISTFWTPSDDCLVASGQSSSRWCHTHVAEDYTVKRTSANPFAPLFEGRCEAIRQTNTLTTSSSTGKMCSDFMVNVLSICWLIL